MKTYSKPFVRGVSWRSQNYGTNPGGYNPAGGHTGLDEAANSGTPVHAAGDGVIEFAGEFDDSYADNLLWLINYGGNTIVLNCGDDEPSFVYAHLERFHVKRGDVVRKGQVIADSGNSGAATTGSHLHVEAIPPGYNLGSSTFGRTNPDKYMTEWPEDILAVRTKIPATIIEENMKLFINNPGNGKIYLSNGLSHWHLSPAALSDYQKLSKWGVLDIYKHGEVQSYPIHVMGVEAK